MNEKEDTSKKRKLLHQKTAVTASSVNVPTNVPIGELTVQQYMQLMSSRFPKLNSREDDYSEVLNGNNPTEGFNNSTQLISPVIFQAKISCPTLTSLWDNIIDKSNSNRKPMSIVINGVQQDEPNTNSIMESLFSNKRFNWQQIFKIHLPQNLNFGTKVSCRDDIFWRLSEVSESTFETELAHPDKSESILYGLDSHHENHNAPFFKTPHINEVERFGNHNDNVHHNCLIATATPKRTSLVAVMFIEWKSHDANSSTLTYGKHEYEVLEQSLERVIATSSLNETYKQIICFATTGTYSWIVLLEQRDNTNQLLRKFQSTLFVYNIDRMDILPLWDLFNEQALSSEYASNMFHSDGFVVQELLKTIQVHGGYCAVKRLDVGCSSSRLYAIHLPRFTNAAVFVDFSKIDFVIKIHGNNTRCKNELQILRMLHDYSINHPDTIYAHKYVISLFEKDLKNMSQKIDVFYSEEQVNKMFDELTLRHYNVASVKRCYKKHKRPLPLTCSALINFCDAKYFPPSALPFGERLWWNRQIVQDCTKMLGGMMMFCGNRYGVLDKPSLDMCLEEIGMARIFHTDLRIANFMYFDTIPFIPSDRRSFIIDFDLAVTMAVGRADATVPIPSAGNQLELWQHVFGQTLDGKVSVVWNISREVGMFACQWTAYHQRMFGNKATNSNSGTSSSDEDDNGPQEK